MPAPAGARPAAPIARGERTGASPPPAAPARPEEPSAPGAPGTWIPGHGRQGREEGRRSAPRADPAEAPRPALRRYLPSGRHGHPNRLSTGSLTRGASGSRCAV
ncbi:PREDICTED: translation initiation factor IF-2-like [Chinchilla lanigera]|uniref:translation initiation factor IF-2-like n=1 Tax=Chinchilla lanigera TaxID=34839 RepID=UPI000695C5D3|nr:PREDICTED: translation initiation factor IF-2-like [Chinchilla lanigera]